MAEKLINNKLLIIKGILTEKCGLHPDLYDELIDLLDDIRILSDAKDKELQSIKVNCNHKPSKLPYLAWHNWADRKTRQGHIQKQCPECKLWLFKCEM